MITRFILISSFLVICSFAAFGQESALSVPGLQGAVTVSRDARTIPYIQAGSDADLYFAQGYVTASDRLWQMDLLRRLARGETAEIFGNSVLEEDKRWRRFGFSSIAEASFAKLTPELQAALKNYARGVNAYIATLDEKTLPVEFRILQYRPAPWRETDTIVIGKILADALSTTWRNDLMRASLQNLSPEKYKDVTNQVTPYDVVLFGDDKKGTAGPMQKQTISSSILAAADRDADLRAAGLERIGLYAEGLAASNNWVISGRRTADGKPILANDPHLSPSVPGIWYMSHLSAPGLRVAGVTFPGVPGIVLGHNGSIAWGATNVGPDVQDLYLETFNDKGEYKTSAGWKKAAVRVEEIKVRTNPLNPATTVTRLEVRETGNGPIIVEDGAKKYSLRWTARDTQNNEFEAFFLANRAKNWNEFKNALKQYGGATQNFVYADVNGNIGWYAAGRIPTRRTGDGALPYDGSTNDGDWTGYIPFDELPNLYNPPSGLIVTANQRIVGTSYKYPQLSRDVAPPWRARRIYNVLSSKSKITMDDVRDVQMDTFNIPLSDLAKEIVSKNAASPETITVLKSWDGRMDPNSRGALLVNEIRNCVGEVLGEENASVPAVVLRERVVDWAVREQSGRWLPARFSSYADLLKSCDARTRTSLGDPKRYGPDSSTWTWGRYWLSRFGHPLASAPLIGAQFIIPPVSLGGSGQTPNVGSSVSMRFIASPGNWDITRHAIPLGQSGDPRSPHFKDQLEPWRTGTMGIFPFTKGAVEKASVSKVRLSSH